MYSEKCEKCNTLNQSGRITSLCEKCLEIVDENNLKVGNKESDNESDESGSSSDSNEESDEESDEKSEELDAEVDDAEVDDDEPDIDEPDIDESANTNSAIVESILYDSDLKKSDDLLNHRIIVDPDRRITSNVITQLEIARAIAIRAANIDARGHDNAFVDTKGCDSAGEIAKKEFYSRRSPLKLMRHVGNNEWEEFLVREMTFK